MWSEGCVNLETLTGPFKNMVVLSVLRGDQPGDWDLCEIDKSINLGSDECDT